MTQGLARVDTIVFDIGGVLLDWDPRHLYRKLFADEAAREWFLAHVCTPDWNREQDRGRPWAEAVAGLAQAFPEWRAEIAAYDARWSETVAGPIEGSVDILRRLHADGAPLYAITNFSAEKFKLAQARFDFLSLWRGVIVSGEERLLKPDPAIYQLLLSRYGLAAARCLFIDDVQHNVDAARAIGMQAVRFVDPPTLRRDLAAAGFET